jgi:hypothetical protein
VGWSRGRHPPVQSGYVPSRTYDCIAICDIGAGNRPSWLLKSESEDIAETARHFGSSQSPNPPLLLIDYIEPVPPRLDAIRVQDENLTFQISGVPGWIYRVQSRKDVDQGAWVTLTNAVAGAALNPIVISLHADHERGFYRVMIE